MNTLRNSFAHFCSLLDIADIKKSTHEAYGQGSSIESFLRLYCFINFIYNIINILYLLKFYIEKFILKFILKV